ncbi:lipoyl(octanoyl) transferase LipB [Methylophaga aminisulfidivorans]|uniref:Octanoyltransferase n=1 Tax=Methylophaga aminisulfidivorans MP TaxID=1026882 RepID=F5T2P3_9GAMM|nr:lipoyl(octanoyl) transferase LipB [Methylophaga aminisulfidivorans]EGL53261.1 lipoate-protein ligase B [Methylophaga aminisulfidivorans MP]
MQIKDLGLVDYLPTVDAMQSFTLKRQADTEDQLWLLEHSPVFTQGANGDAAHILMDSAIPVVSTDRGGQVTYHGPGQLVVYTLIDLRRAGIGVRQMVTNIEQTVVNLLAQYGVDAYARQDAPGVYVDERKIASLGLRVKRGACYHGVSLNIDMDLTPFSYINPCGYAGMEVIDIRSLGIDITMTEAKQQFVSAFQQQTQLG